MQTPTPDDPINRWATEHYGFEDETAEPSGSAPSARAPGQTTARHSGPRRRIVRASAGALGLLLTFGLSGAAIAAAADGGGRADTAQLDGGGRGTVQLDHGFDGDFTGGGGERGGRR